MSSVCGVCGEDSNVRVVLKASYSECGTSLDQLLWLLSSRMIKEFSDLVNVCAICLEKTKMMIETMINMRKNFIMTQVLLKTYYEKSLNITWSEFKNSSIVEDIKNDKYVKHKFKDAESLDIWSLEIKNDVVENDTNDKISMVKYVNDDDYTNLEWLNDDTIENYPEINDNQIENNSGKQTINTKDTTDNPKAKNYKFPRPHNRVTRRGQAYTTISGEYVVKKDDGMYSCKLCKMEFNFPSRAECHVRSIHLQERPFECKVCNKKFTASHLLKRHFSSVHNEPKYICEICGQQFNRPYMLVAHEKNHVGPPSVICTQEGCDKKFYSELCLKMHLRRFHSEKKIVCDKCGKLFRQNSRLLEHVKRKHKLDE